MCAKLLQSHITLTLWTVAHQARLSMEFFRQESWMGFHCLLWGILLTKGSNLCHLHLLYVQADSLPLAPAGKPKR